MPSKPTVRANPPANLTMCEALPRRDEAGAGIPRDVPCTKTILFLPLPASFRLQTLRRPLPFTTIAWSILDMSDHSRSWTRGIRFPALINA